MTWAAGACVAVLLVVLAILALDSRSTRQKLRNQDGVVTGLRLDLDAAVARIAELQGYLADYDSWAATPSRPVPPRIADRAVPDRWATPPHGAPRQPTTAVPAEPEPGRS